MRLMTRKHFFAGMSLTALMLAFSVTLAPNVASYSAPRLQSIGTRTTLRRIQVNARTISALAAGRNYVVDLTQRGVKYEFDPQGGQIDFTRVMVRTARGEVAIGSFLEKVIPKDKITTFRYTSQSFSLGTQPKLGVQNTTSKTVEPNSDLDIKCGSFACTCRGEISCQKMLDNLNCSSFFCTSDGPEVFCSCVLGTP